MIKFNYVYFNYLVRMLFAKEIGIINDLEFNEVLNNMRNLKHSFLFDFHPGLIKRSFVQVMQKVDEIERKVEIRKSYKNLLKVVK